ncbi:MAG: helix-turn-helix transcriptional regulator, partial [Ekhidna sp.]|nr:helix-turn-helix transcriptional regulator [Ekhidna sp.]
TAETKFSLLKVKWLRFIFYVSLFQVWSYYTHIVLTTLELVPASDVFGWFLVVLDLVLVNGLIFIAMKYPELATGVSALKDRIKNYPEEKYQYSKLEAPKAQKIIQEIRQFVEEQTAYRNAELSLGDVATSTGYESKLISQAINQYLKLNFKQYVNKVRLEAAERMLSSSDHAEMRINEIMYAVGFNSKSAFSTLFKEKNGCTPNEYRKNRNKAVV